MSQQFLMTHYAILIMDRQPNKGLPEPHPTPLPPKKINPKEGLTPPPKKRGPLTTQKAPSKTPPPEKKFPLLEHQPSWVKDGREEPGCEDLPPVRGEGESVAVGLLAPKVNAGVLPRVRVVEAWFFNPASS